MKRRAFLIHVPAVSSCMLWIARQELRAQGGKKFGQLMKELNVTPQQEAQLVPILEQEAPKLEAIKGNPSLSHMQKMEQLKAIHEETNPRVKSILTPEQYEKFQEIRKKEIQQGLRKKMHQ